jgi:cell division protein FtsL
MTNSRIGKVVPYRWILSLAMGAVIFYLAVSFVMQMGTSLELREKRHRIEQGIAAAEKANAELEARLQYISSDAAAEEWARENGWARQDEVLVVVLAPEAGNSPQDERQQGDQVNPVSVRDSWWDLFFGQN